MQNRDPNRSNQGKDFDVDSNPMDWLDLAQLAFGWLVVMCVAGLVGSALGWLK